MTGDARRNAFPVLAALGVGLVMSVNIITALGTNDEYLSGWVRQPIVIVHYVAISLAAAALAGLTVGILTGTTFPRGFEVAVAALLVSAIAVATLKAYMDGVKGWLQEPRVMVGMSLTVLSLGLVAIPRSAARLRRIAAGVIVLLLVVGLTLVTLVNLTDYRAFG